ncbi:MAG: IS21 family transposase [Planctomycetaceae bacterium]
MANRLAMNKSQAIKRLAASGMSERQIARTLEVSRKAVRQRLGRGAPKETKAPPGEAPPGSPGAKDTKAPTGSQEPTSPSAGESRSLCAAYQSSILEMLERGLTAQRIFQDLRDEQGFPGRYSSVRRYVRRLTEGTELAFRRVEVPPGYEMQVDYGSGAPCWDEAGKRCRTHLFRLVLSFSRKGYSEAVRRLTTESFIRSLENAFWALGGVPQVVVFDNARAVVSQADWYDPELNPKIVEFCRHYDVTLLPTRPRMPRHKGKVERGVGYAKSNALRGREFDSLAAENEFLRHWERSVADTRIHGTTKQHVGQLFESKERAALRPLPRERFPFYEEGQRHVSRDGHIEVRCAYYSVPPEYLGCDVWVRWNEQVVRILNHRFEQIALHCRQPPGKFSTLHEHLASQKISSVERGAEYLLRKVRLLGTHAARWSEATLEEHGVRGMRIIQGLLALSRQYEASAIDAACEKAWRGRGFRYRIVKHLLERQEAATQQTLEFLDVHPVIRPISDYAEFVRHALQQG